jgi:hypothetical protein
MPASSGKADLYQQADFVFEGTVKKVNAGAKANVSAADQTAIVAVDRIVHAPKLLSDYEGKNITVRLSSQGKVKVGQTALFYTNPTEWGENIAVTSIGHQPLNKVSDKLSRSAIVSEDPYQALVNRDMKARLNSSDLVVFGKVTSVSLPSDAAAQELYREHDPLWRDAEITIGEVVKGKYSGKTVTVRFPSSEDIKWNDSPKFHVGEEGYVLLRKQEIGGRRFAGKVAKKTAEAYTALSPLDFQPADKGDSLKQLAAI